MRLVDADALSEKLCETTIFIKGGEAFQRMINDATTIDAVPVVRCIDCIFWYDCEYTFKSENGFCCCGARE